MLATIINAASIIVGSLLGLLLKNKVQEKHKELIYTSIGLVCLVIGLSMALKTKEILILAFSIPLGGFIGEWLDIEGAILKFGNWLKNRFQQKKEGEANFAAGFLSATVLFCVGAMAIIGSFKAGVEGNYDLLFTKSAMDGMIAILFAAALGAGVAFSALSILLYQGSLTFLSVWLKPLVSEPLLNEITAVGGVLIIMIALNLLSLKKIKTGNFLPAVVMAIVLIIGKSVLKI